MRSITMISMESDTDGDFRHMKILWKDFEM